MTAIDGYKIYDDVENSIEIFGSTITKRDSLRKYLNSLFIKSNKLIGDIIKIPSDCDFKIKINRYEDIVLVIVEDELKNKCYYLFDEELRYLNVINNGEKVELKTKDRVIINESLDDSLNTSTLVHFINYLNNLQKIISFNFNSAILCSSLRIFNGENDKIIVENEELIFAQHNFYKDDIHKIHYDVVLKKGLRVIGSIECRLNDENISNFAYSGNLSFNIFKDNLNMGYERKILSLLKKHLEESDTRVNKTLFIAAMEEDETLVNAAVSNGGYLSYDGVVPSSDPLYFMGKVKNIKVYRIG